MDIYQMECLRYFLAFLGTIIFIYILCTKKKIINLDKVYPTKREFVKKYYKIFNGSSKIALILFITFSIFWIIIPGFIDLKNYINREFKIANSKVIAGDADKTIFKRRHINVINVDTGEILELDVGYTPIFKGEYYTIEYLPNVKVGEIIKIGQ